MLDSSSPPLVSVHFPKASGTSFRAALVAALGAAAVGFDYQDDPADPASPYRLIPAAFLARRPTTMGAFRAVHGHFPIAKYDLVEPAIRVVMLRDPVATMISIYCYWQHLASRGETGHALFEMFKRVQPGICELAASPLLRVLMSETYFGGVDMGRFDVIGDYADQAGYYRAVSTLFGVILRPAFTENTGADRVQRDRLLNDGKITAGLRDVLAQDIRFFERHVGRGIV